MKCPKCLYISFDNGDRCRNCGYEFSLTTDVDALDLPMQTGDEPWGPLADLSLFTDSEQPRAAPDSGPLARLELGRHQPARAPAPAVSAGTRGAGARRASPTPPELPLFGARGAPDDQPLVTPSTVPRVPLSVRRSTPVLPRPRSHAQPEPALALEFQTVADEPPAATPARRSTTPVPAAADAGRGGLTAHEPAGAVRRMSAAAIDLCILGAFNLGVLYFTLQLTRLGLDDLHVLPRIPMAGFLLLLNGGYFVMFTAAGGQTIGKMATAIRVVPADAGGQTRDRVPLGHAIVRAAGYAVSLLPAGLGYLPALVGRERRAIHDRLADTRVVKA